MIVKGAAVELLPAYQDAGDELLAWIAVDNEENGRVSISPINTGLAIPPTYVVKVEWLVA